MVGNPTGEGGFPTMWLEIQPLPLVGPDVVVPACEDQFWLGVVEMEGNDTKNDDNSV